MICIILKMRVRPEKVAWLEGTMRKLIPEVRKEPGNHACFFIGCPVNRTGFSTICSTDSVRPQTNLPSPYPVR